MSNSEQTTDKAKHLGYVVPWCFYEPRICFYYPIQSTTTQIYTIWAF